MYQPSIAELERFYASPTGRPVERNIRSVISRIWPSSSREDILGLGYALPYLDCFSQGNNLVIAAFPKNMGGTCWPSADPVRSCVVESEALPFFDHAFNRILVVHALEYGRELRKFAKEMWRVLVPEGRALVFIPNSKSLWAYHSSTPLGLGNSYSAYQMRRLFIHHDFDVVRCCTLLFVPPSKHFSSVSAVKYWEAAGNFLFRPFGGLLCLEIQKKLPGMRPLRIQPVEERVIIPASPVPSA